MWLLEPCPVPLPNDIEELLIHYPFKQFQFWFQGIDPRAVVDYHRRRLERLAGEEHLLVMAEGERYGACFRLHESPWHSEIFGYRFFRIEDLLTLRTESDTAPEAVSAALELATQDEAEVVEIRIDSSDFAVAECLFNTGFQSMGHTVKMNAHLSGYDAAFLERMASAAPDYVIAPAGEKDLKILPDLAAMTHSHSHFFNDPRMAEKARERLFPQWTLRCATGLAEQTLVARRGNEVAGFVTCMINRGLKEATGHTFGIIDFIAVAPGHQGQGVGKALVAEALRFLRQECTLAEIRTMNDNYRAIALYHRFGFTLTGSDQVFHLWF